MLTFVLFLVLTLIFGFLSLIKSKPPNFPPGRIL